MDAQTISGDAARPAERERATEFPRRVMREAWRRCSDPARRILRAFDAKIPFVFDLVEDTARFRGLTPALFALIISFLFRTGLHYLFLTNPLSNANDSQQIIRTQQRTESVEIGKFSGSTFSARLTDSAGQPLVGVRAHLDAQLQLPKSSGGQGSRAVDWITKFGYSGTHYAESGLPLNGVYSVPGFPPSILSSPSFAGNSTVSDKEGWVRFRNYRMLIGIPGTYTASIVVGDTVTTAGRITFTSKVAQVVLLSSTYPEEIAWAWDGFVHIGRRLPPITVRVLGQNGIPLSGKTVVLIPAPPESAEYASVGSSNDIFGPRRTLLQGAASAPTDGNGTTTLADVVLAATSLRRIRLFAVVDGIIGRDSGGQRAIQFSLPPAMFLNRSTSRPVVPAAAVAHTDEAMDEYKITIVTQPSPNVTEGEELSIQPVVRVYRYMRRASDGTLFLTPAKGTRVYAFPYEQDGFKGDTVMTPAGSAELGVTREEKWAVLGTLGAAKHLFNALSAPADAEGIARFEKVGFIRHGPAGNYTLSFACAGLHLYAETRRILVLSSVETVQYWVPNATDAYGRYTQIAQEAARYLNVSVPLGEGPSGLNPSDDWTLRDLRYQLPHVASVICTWPTCDSKTGSPTGMSPRENAPYTGKLYPPDLRKVAAEDTPHAPSGVLSYAPIVFIKDRAHNVLAGKTVRPVITGDDAGLAPASCIGMYKHVKLVEMPFAGAAVTKLATPFEVGVDPGTAPLRPTTAKYAEEPLDMMGTLAFARMNLRADDAFDERVLYGSHVASWSFLRVLQSPCPYSAVTWALLVDGVWPAEAARDASDHQGTLHVFNYDTIGFKRMNTSAQDLCGHVNILQSPSSVLQAESSEVSFLAADGITPQPFIVQAVNTYGEPVPAESVEMYVTDALGSIAYSTVGNAVVGLTSAYVRMLRSLGGGAALTYGNGSVTGLGLWMHGPARLLDTDRRGVAVFPGFTLRHAQNTWLRVSFAVRHVGRVGRRWYNFDVRETDPDVLEHSRKELLSGLASVEEPLFEDGLHNVLPTVASCTSQYSSPVAIHSTVAHMEWRQLSGTGDNRATRSISVATSSSTTGLATVYPLPYSAAVYPSQYAVAAFGPQGWIQHLPRPFYVSRIDEAMQTYPAHMGVRAYDNGFLPSVLTSRFILTNLGVFKFPRADRYEVEETSLADRLFPAALSAGLPSALATNAKIFRASNSTAVYLYGSYKPLAVVDVDDMGEGGSAIATFPDLSIKRGVVGSVPLSVFAGGVVMESPPVQVANRDTVNAVLVHDWSVGELSECFGGTPLRDVKTWEGNGDVTPDNADVCAPAAGSVVCSGHGRCVCNYCVCAPGWDGSVDCSVPFYEDTYAATFLLDAQYAEDSSTDNTSMPTYGGLPVYDVLHAQQLSEKSRYFGDLFPRFLLAKSVDIGTLTLGTNPRSDFVAVLQRRLLGFDVPGVLPIEERIGDAVNALLINSTSTGAGTNASQAPPTRTDAFTEAVQEAFTTYNPKFDAPASVGDYRVFPVLFTCSGEQVFDWAFTLGSTGCRQDTVAVVSNVNVQDRGSSNFSFYRLQLLSDLGRDGKPLYRSVPAFDRRLQLTGVPTGCYRFKYVYAPMGPGVRQGRTIDDPWQSAQAHSLAASRPFRVLGPIRSMQVANKLDGEDQVTVPRGTPLPQGITIKLVPRSAGRGLSEPAADDCADSPNLRTQVRRCPPIAALGYGGLEVTMTAVSLTNGAEYSLFTTDKYVDCARALPLRDEQSGDIDGDSLYYATFSGIEFPLAPAPIPYGAGARTALAIPVPPGLYILRFNAYGTVLDAPMRIRVVDAPTHVVAAGPDVRLLVRQSDFLSEEESDAFVSNLSDDDMKVTLDSGMSVVPDFVHVGLGVSYRPASIFGVIQWVRQAAHLTRALQLNITYKAEAAAHLTLALAIAPDGNPSLRTGFLAVPGISATMELLYCPPLANVYVDPSLTTTDVPEGELWGKASIPVTSALPGWYVFAISTPNLPPESRAIVIYQYVSKMVKDIRVTIAGEPVPVPPCRVQGRCNVERATQHVASTVIVATDRQPVTRQPIRYCVTNEAGEPGLNQRVTIRLIRPPTDLEAALQPVNTTSGFPRWFSLLSQHARHGLYAYGSEDPRLDVDPGMYLRVTGVRPCIGRGCLGGRTTVYSGPLAQLPDISTPNDGCFTIESYEFRDVREPLTAHLVVAIRGQEAPPIPFKIQRLQDANPITTDMLRDRVAIPVLASMPLFAANTVSMPVAVRALMLLLGGIALGGIAWVDGQTFYQEHLNMVGAFSQQDRDFILALNIIWTISLCAVVLYSLVAALTMRARVWGSLQTLGRLCCTGKGRKSWEAVGSFRARIMLQQIGDSFYAERFEAAWVYVRQRLPRIGAASRSLKRSSGSWKDALAMYAQTQEGKTAQVKVNRAVAGGVHKATEEQLSCSARARARLGEGWVRCVGRMPKEDPGLAFYFPQRLLVAAVVSALCCSLVGMLMAYSFGQAVRWASERTAAILDSRSALIASVVETVQREAVEAGAAALAAVQGAGLDASRVTGAGECSEQSIIAVAAAQAASIEDSLASTMSARVLDEGLTGMLSPVLGRLTLPTEDLRTVDRAAQALMESQGSILEPLLQNTIAHAQRSLFIGMGLAAVAVLLSWADFLVSYKRRVLTIRAGGVWLLKPGHHGVRDPRAGLGRAEANPADVVAFVGVQAAGTAISFLLTSLFLGLIAGLLSVPRIQRELSAYITSIALPVLGIGAGLTFLRLFVLRYMVARGQRIALRRMFSILDLWFTVFNVITGLLIAVMSVSLSLFTFLTMAMRPDKPLAEGQDRDDPAANSYAALLHLDTTFHNPVYMMASDCLLATLSHVRWLAQKGAAASLATLHRGDQDAQATAVTAALGKARAMVKQAEKSVKSALPSVGKPATASSHLASGGASIAVPASSARYLVNPLRLPSLVKAGEVARANGQVQGVSPLEGEPGKEANRRWVSLGLGLSPSLGSSPPSSASPDGSSTGEASEVVDFDPTGVDEPLIEARALYMSSTRVRTRWWLWALLLRHPGLRKYRKQVMALPPPPSRPPPAVEAHRRAVGVAMSADPLLFQRRGPSFLTGPRPLGVPPPPPVLLDVGPLSPARRDRIMYAAVTPPSSPAQSVSSRARGGREEGSLSAGYTSTSGTGVGLHEPVLGEGAEQGLGVYSPGAPLSPALSSPASSVAPSSPASASRSMGARGW